MKAQPNTQTPAQRITSELAAGVGAEQLLHTLQLALSADTVARDGSRQPDHRSRLEATKILLSYTVGLPTQRQEIVSVNLDLDAAANMEERLRHSPAMRAAMRKMLEDAEGALDV